MRALLGGLALATLLAPGQTAAAREYPWCAIYDQGGSVTNCGFDTLEQCKWTISGAGGYCAENGFYVAPKAEPQPVMAPVAAPASRPKKSKPLQ